MAYLDFDTILICNNDFSEAFVSDCFSFFHEHGIRNFIFTYDLPLYSARPLSEGLRTFRTLKPYLERFRPRGARIYTACNLIFDRDVALDPEVRRLTISGSDRLFLTLPLFGENEWLESDLSHLLYRKHFQPVFVSFERNAITYNDGMFERFSRLPKAVFALDANYIFSLHAQKKLTHLIRSGVPILPCVSNRMSDYVALSDGYRDLKQRLGMARYRELCKCMREAGVCLRRDFMNSRRPRS